MEPVSEQGPNQSLWSSSWASTGNEHAGGLALSKMGTIDAEGTFHSVINDSVHSVDVPLQNPNCQDHEMFSWLQFPTDDAIEKGFFTDLIREVPGSTVQIVKHSFNQLGLQQELRAVPLNSSEALVNDLVPANPGFSSISIGNGLQGVEEAVEFCSGSRSEVRNMVAGADAAQRETVMGISASDIGGAEAFSRMQASPSVESNRQDAMPIAKLKDVDTVPFVNTNPSLLNPLKHQFSSPSQEASSLPILKPLDVSLCTVQPTLQRNFSHFSSPVAETRANLHALSASIGPSSMERARQHHGQSGNAVSNMNTMVFQTGLVAVDIDSSLEPLPSETPLPVASIGQTGETSKGKSIAEDNLVSSHLSNGAITASNIAMEKLHITEQMAKSPSQGSDSSSDEKSGKEATTILKRRSSGINDSECQSEDPEEATNSSKKSTKRSRATQMHNLCERKRRDRINEKLMALRDLMPNSSKTAKASILDEAIEYVKLLQSQLQAWSARTGMCIPPALIPSMGRQHSQMPAMPHMGLGVGMGIGLGMSMGMGMGMGVMDVNAAAVAAGRTVVPLPSCPPRPSSLPSPAMGPSQSCPPTTGVLEGQEPIQSAPCSTYVPQHQAQMQPSPMNMTMYRSMELYNAYLNGQQQQHHQWQQQHHQWQLMHKQQSQGNNASKPAR